MESLTRLVSESMARHGFERPVDYRRLRWSRWVRCESHHSLLSVPSRPGVFAIAEEVLDLGTVSTDAGKDPAAGLSREVNGSAETGSRKSDTAEAPRMLAVSKFCEDDDMAFTLDRMLSWQSPMRTNLESGRYFIRYVVIEDHAQRHSICNALNQWIANSGERATGISSHFATSLEFSAPEPNVARAPASTSPDLCPTSATDIGCPSLFPSGF